MPVTQFVETSQSRKASIARRGKRADSTLTVEYMAFGTSSDIEVHAYANTYFTTNRFYQIADYLFMVESYDVEYQGDDVFRVTATYTKTGTDDENQPEPLRRSRSFDTSGATTHITQSPQYDVTLVDSVVNGPDGLPLVEVITTGERRYPLANQTGPAPSQFGAIGVDGDSVSGVDIVTPSLQWTETYDVPSTYVDQTYIKRVAFRTGTVNNAAFRTFLAGEVLFLGCSGNQEWDSEKGDGPWSLSYKFVASPNAGVNQTIPALQIGTITGIEKKGHEYLWVRYESQVSGSAGQRKVPKYVYVNQVYASSNFADLGIGT